jgi:hypothetical protein
MATFTGTRAAVDFPVTKPPAGALGVAWGSIEVTANPVAADIYRLCRLPAGAIVVGGYMFGDDLDTNATETLDLDLGWEANGAEAADADGFGNFAAQVTDTVAGIKPESGIMFPMGGVAITTGPLGMTFTRETIVSVTTVATAATFAAGTLGCVIYFTVP